MGTFNDIKGRSTIGFSADPDAPEDTHESFRALMTRNDPTIDKLAARPSTSSQLPVDIDDKEDDMSKAIRRTQVFSHYRTMRKNVRNLFWSLLLTKGFEAVSAFVIIANGIVIGMAADYAMKSPFAPDDPVLAKCELSFIAFYVVEIGIRGWSQGRQYFLSPENRSWNIFDLILVAQGVWEQLEKLVLPSQDAQGVNNLSFLRLLRLVKMLKLLRMVRLLRTFRELRLILSSIFGCVKSMMWTGILVLAISCMFGVAILQSCTYYVQSEGDDVPAVVYDSIDRYWNCVLQALLTLYMSAMGGEDWIKIIEPLSRVGKFVYALFLIYIALFAFVVMNTISSVFLESMMTNANRDHQLVIEMQMEHKEDYISKLRMFYDEIDEDGDGEISYAEFCTHMDSPHMQAFAASLEIEITDAKQFFQVISDRGQRSVDIETFVVGCIKNKGPAKSVDLMDLAYSYKKAQMEQRKAFHELHKVFTEQRAFDQVVLRDFERLFRYLERLMERLVTATGRPHGLKKGDKVMVTKESGMKGKLATVIDPFWQNFFVKVRMDDLDVKGIIKSYKPSELELRTSAHQAGDRVRVNQDGSMKGKYGVVLDADWNGLVKVEMEEADPQMGHITSYEAAELDADWHEQMDETSHSAEEGVEVTS